MVLEIIGYIASILIAISLMMKSVVRLRIINLIGAIFFVIYGFLIKAYPIAAVNFIIVLIDIYYLLQIVQSEEYFSILNVRSDSKYFEYFLVFYKDEIIRFFPDFSFRSYPVEKYLAFFILRDMMPAGLFIGEVEDGVCTVILDFAAPNYRDLKIGKYLFHNTIIFKEHNIHSLQCTSRNPLHIRYLEKMGFSENGTKDGRAHYCLNF